MAGPTIASLRRRGLRGITRAVSSRARSLLGIRAKSFAAARDLFLDKSGLEVGGPSQLFSRDGAFPVYGLAARIDNCNFGSATVWEGRIQEGETFHFDSAKPPGTQYVMEATAMERIPSAAYDFVLASHVLEHVANPLLALSEWKRILRDGGALIVVLPERTQTFDHRRPLTTLEHLIADHRAQTTESDLTHLPEILDLHDLQRDPEAGDPALFRERCRHNAENRCLHHHVFDRRLAVVVVEQAGLQVQASEEVPPMHILVVARKPGGGGPLA
jgi:SAM-dependent methyltransferase